MERDWTYFALIGLGVILLWAWHRRRHGRGGSLLPVVAAILAVIAVLYLAIGV
ncbi:MAG: hypothetical protein HOK54_11620 [Alphaproteobacteria bacterium]|nr:hypothetical protein [Alphaproteobacteria bacterium]